MDRQMITDAADYFAKGCGRCDRFDSADCASRIWSEVLIELRRLCCAAGLEETAKWGHPCYVHAGRNIAIIGAFRDHVRLSFFASALMKDPEGVLEKQGPHTQHAGMIRLGSIDDLARLAPVISAYLAEAKSYADAGIKPPKVQASFDLPDELVEALDADPVYAEAFAALTPGRQRSYAIVIGGAKQSATRSARVAKYRDKVLSGKGAQER